MLNQQQKKQNNFFTIQNSIQTIEQGLKRVISKKGAKVIINGDDNLLPQNIATIVKESSTLSSVIKSKAEYVSYGELICENTQVLDKLTKNLNKDYNYYELAKRLSMDFFSQGWAVLECTIIGKEKFLYHLDSTKVRLVDYLGNMPEIVAISNDWEDPKEEIIQCALYPNVTEFEINGAKTQRQIIIIKDYSPAIKHYNTPQWQGALYDAQIESLIGQYNSNQFENGITLSSILSFDFGEVAVTDLQENETEGDWYKNQTKKLENNLKGTSKQRGGKTLVVPINSGVVEPKYVTFPMDKEGSYTQLQSLVENNIIKANNWFRSLAGLVTSGQLGNNQQLKNEWQLAERQIRNTQDLIMSEVKKVLDLKDEISFNNQSPLDLIEDISKVREILESTLSVEVKKELLILLGMEVVQAEKFIINDSK